LFRSSTLPAVFAELLLLISILTLLCQTVSSPLVGLWAALLVDIIGKEDAEYDLPAANWWSPVDGAVMLVWISTLLESDPWALEP